MKIGDIVTIPKGVKYARMTAKVVAVEEDNVTVRCARYVRGMTIDIYVTYSISHTDEP